MDIYLFGLEGNSSNLIRRPILCLIVSNFPGSILCSITVQLNSTEDQMLPGFGYKYLLVGSIHCWL